LFPGQSRYGRRVHILLNYGFPGWLPLFFRQPLGIGNSRLLGFLCIDNGKMILLAQLIRNPAYSGNVCFLIAPVFLSIRKGYRVPDQVVVQAFGIQVGADYHLKFSV